MGREALIACFQDTLQISKTKLSEKTMFSVNSNKVYKENFVSKAEHKDEHAFVSVHAGSTFDVAKDYCRFGKVAVLNFANPEIPGGGICNGAMAQEECLCRSSNLYACINNENVFEEYYGYHRGLKNYFFSDRLIYTKDVTVFKDDAVVPQLLPEEEWFDVDIITCAAPYVAKRKYTNSTALLSLFKRRIKNVFEAARENKVDVIILGAWGCGAFKNPPSIVAEAFRQTIIEQDYFADFKQIVFAIKPTGKNCPNLRNFDKLDPFVGVGCELLLDSSELEVGSRCPAIPTESRFFDNIEFRSWQLENKYFRKQFSILGDSISTLDGYNPKGYKVFYSGENCEKSGVVDMQDTWWDKVIGFFGGELLVNNSWSGSRVAKLKDKEKLFPSGCSDERTASLHINDVTPDVILVYLGTNDWANATELLNGGCDNEEDENWSGTMLLSDEECFDVAYEQMLTKLRVSYPNAEIWCCTLCETYISKKPDFKFPHKYAGIHIEKYNNVIRDIVERNGCGLIDLYDYKMAYDSIDGSHPNATGMNTIATMIVRSIAGTDADQFLDCEDGQHEYTVVEEYTGGTRYICSRCGKTNYKSSLSHIEYQEDQQEYVMLDLDITMPLYSDILRLAIEGSGKMVEFPKDVVEVGRDKICDLSFDGNYIARRHATFLHERDMWFLRDNFSTNGTWLNGTKIQPGKKYQLAANDEINFAVTEQVIFDKREWNVQPEGDSEGKALIFLEAGMSTFTKSEYKDEVALKLIMVALSDAPLYFPVEIDLEAMLGSIDPTKLKAGDTLQPSKDVKMRILTITPKNGVEFVPMFTSNEEVNKGPSASIIRFYPQDYLPKLI